MSMGPLSTGHCLQSASQGSIEVPTAIESRVTFLLQQEAAKDDLLENLENSLCVMIEKQQEKKTKLASQIALPSQQQKKITVTASVKKGPRICSEMALESSRSTFTLESPST